MEWEGIAHALYDGRDDEVAALTREALQEGHSADEVLNQGLLPGMDRVAEDFEKDIISVPEVLIAADGMLAGMEVLRPLLSETARTKVATFVAETVKGDIHDIGKKLVGIMLKGAGIEIIDLGKDTSLEKSVEAVKEYQPQALLMSALLATTTGDPGVIRGQAGYDGLTPDQHAIIDHIGPEGFHVVTGSSGRGFKLARPLASVWLNSLLKAQRRGWIPHLSG